ncbi:MAG: ABC transporter permease [Proteobacteria bacterium]|nr:ABC transporter permease [Pseudomonadota bacterium]
MNVKRMWAMFRARNREFFRDRAAFGWNFIFPFLLVGGFAVIFGSDRHNEYKIGVFPVSSPTIQVEQLSLPEGFKNQRSFKFVPFPGQKEGVDKLTHHKIDFLVRNHSAANDYWVSDTSQKGYIVEQIFNASLIETDNRILGNKRNIEGKEIRFIDWFFPGILAMNMMFSALYGVGYVVVRYRKNGVLKRLKATPLTALEYLSSQMLSRNFLIMFTLVVVWIGCDLLFSFQVEGSYLNLFLVFFLGSLSLTALGLALAARGTSEEFTSGVINFISWPMMFLSEVWFSLEGAPQWVKTASQVFPLTHLLTALRAIMNDGAGLIDVSSQLIILTIMTLCFLFIGSAAFSWNR